MPQLRQEYLSIKWKMPMNEYELVYLAQEQNEEAQLLLFQTYASLIDCLLYKQQRYIDELSIDVKDLYSYCLTNFNEAILKYNANKAASFHTFAQAILKRTISGYLYKQRTKMNNAHYIMIEYNENIYNTECAKKDPLNTLSFLTTDAEVENFAKKELSKLEYKVFILLKSGLTYRQIAKNLEKSPKQIDNTIQRIKNKLKKLEKP